MSEHATCCAECAAQQLEQDCNACQAAPLDNSPEVRFQFVTDDDKPRFVATMKPNAARTLIVLLSRLGQTWRAVPLT